MDISILNFFFHLSQANPWLASLAVFFSNYVVYLLPVIVAIYVFYTEKKSYRKVAYVTCVVIAAVGATNLVLKHIFSISRPFVTLNYVPLAQIASLSFPSAHATLAGALFVATWLSLSKHQWFTWLVGILCLCIGISRIMLGVHYPSDILAGFLWGGLASYIGYKVLYKHA